MSTLDEKLAQEKGSGGAARRTYESMLSVRGGVRREHDRDGVVVVSICPMDDRSFWIQVGGGKWNAKSALYERLEEP